MKTVKGIPSIDLSDFRSDDSAQQQHFVDQLGDAYSNIGFVAVHNHGVDADFLKQLYAEVKRFFDLPESVKQQYEIKDLAGQRGYTSFGKEHAKDSNKGDLKEFWHFGQTVTDGDPIEQLYPKNVFCNEVPGFNETGLAIYEALEKLGAELLEAIALYLDLDRNYFQDKIHNGNSILRPIHYPPIQSAPDGAVRAGAHEDINLITLLIGASAEGLQVQNKAGEWIDVSNVENHIVVNVGDMLQRLTNNKLRSTTHRVVNPPKEQWGNSRYSIPFFLHPRADMKLDCLNNCVSESNPAQYAPITAGEYLTERLIEIGLIKA